MLRAVKPQVQPPLRARKQDEARGLAVFYHRVATFAVDPHDLCVTPEVFEAHLAWLASRFEILSLEDLASRALAGSLERDSVAVSLDDGYTDHLEAAAPRAMTLGLPLTYFVTTAPLDVDAEFWWDTLEYLLLDGGDQPGRLALALDGQVLQWDTSTLSGRRSAHDALLRSCYVRNVPERTALLYEVSRWANRALPARRARRALRGDEVARLADCPGATIGSHTVHHLDLMAQRREVAVRELVESRLALGDGGWPHCPHTLLSLRKRRRHARSPGGGSGLRVCLHGRRPRNPPGRSAAAAATAGHRRVVGGGTGQAGRRRDGPRGWCARVTAVRLHVASAGNEFMSHIAGIFVDGFRAEGVLCDLVVDGFPLDAVAPGTLDVVVAPHEFFPLHFLRRRPTIELEPTLAAVALLNVEQPGSQWFDTAWEFAHRARLVFDISLNGVVEFERRGVHAVHTPLGYVPSLEGPGSETPPSTRPVDVLFFGAVSQRRGAFFARHGQFFAGVARSSIWRERPAWRRTGGPGYRSGGDRQRHLSRSRIILGVHSDARDYFEQHRALLALASGALLVTETSRHTAPLQAGRDFVAGALDELPGLCQHYLDHPDELDRIARAGQIAVRILDAGAAQLPGHAGGRRLKAVDRCADRTGATRLAARADCRERPPAATRRHPVDDVAERTRQRHGQTRRFSRGDRLQLRTLSPALPREPCLGDGPARRSRARRCRRRVDGCDRRV